jgi:glycosyltransferase involved in cell wall biosynthesis
MHYLELGGAEMALIGLLHALDQEKVHVDLFIYDHRGPLMRFIPKWINLLPQIDAYAVIERPLFEALKHGHIGVVYGRLSAKYKHHSFLKKHIEGDRHSSLIQYVGDCVTPWLPMINPRVEYDLCISFLTPHNIGRDKVNARKKIAWIHTDYSTVNIDTDSELRVWEAYDNIVSISPQVTKAFANKFPSLASQIIEIENMLPSDYIASRSKEFDVVNEIHGDPKLLSIGRLCTAKNYDNVPDIAKRLVNTYYPGLRWYIIGSGIDESLIRQKIAVAGMEEHVILLGKKDNPYPYIKACDIYVQPSRFEGKSITVREAQLLGKPVVVTNYPTASSQIRDGEDGVIVPLSNDGCARGLADFISNTRLRQYIISNLKKDDFATIGEVNKIYDLLK